MGNNRKMENAPSKEALAPQEPRCLKVSRRGIKTGDDFANYMSSLMSDLVEGRITPNIGNAACNAGGKLLKVVEMKYKYGVEGKGVGNKTIVLAIQDDTTDAEDDSTKAA